MVPEVRTATISCAVLHSFILYLQANKRRFTISLLPGGVLAEARAATTFRAVWHSFILHLQPKIGGPEVSNKL